MYTVLGYDLHHVALPFSCLLSTTSHAEQAEYRKGLLFGFLTPRSHISCFLQVISDGSRFVWHVKKSRYDRRTDSCCDIDFFFASELFFFLHFRHKCHKFLCFQDWRILSVCAVSETHKPGLCSRCNIILENHYAWFSYAWSMAVLRASAHSSIVCYSPSPLSLKNAIIFCWCSGIALTVHAHNSLLGISFFKPNPCSGGRLRLLPWSQTSSAQIEDRLVILFGIHDRLLFTSHNIFHRDRLLLFLLSVSVVFPFYIVYLPLPFRVIDLSSHLNWPPTDPAVVILATLEYRVGIECCLNIPLNFRVDWVQTRLLYSNIG